MHKDRIFQKSLLENKEIDFKNGVVKNIQTAGYNGAHTVDTLGRCYFGLETRVIIKIESHPCMLPFKF